MCTWVDDLFTIPHLLLPILLYHLLPFDPPLRGTLVFTLLLVWEAFELMLISSGSWIIFPGDTPEGECGIAQDLSAGFLGILLASLMPEERGGFLHLLNFILTSLLYSIFAGWDAFLFTSEWPLGHISLYLVHTLSYLSLRAPWANFYALVGYATITVAWIPPKSISTQLMGLLLCFLIPISRRAGAENGG